MAWARIDDGFNEHGKVRAISVPARWAFVASLCYAGRRRDPHIATGDLGLVDATRRIAAELEAVGLWDRNGDGWIIHDWEDYQVTTSAKRTKDWRRRKNDEATESDSG